MAHRTGRGGRCTTRHVHLSAPRRVSVRHVARVSGPRRVSVRHVARVSAPRQSPRPLQHATWPRQSAASPSARHVAQSGSSRLWSPLWTPLLAVCSCRLGRPRPPHPLTLSTPQRAAPPEAPHHRKHRTPGRAAGPPLDGAGPRLLCERLGSEPDVAFRRLRSHEHLLGGAAEDRAVGELLPGVAVGVDREHGAGAGEGVEARDPGAARRAAVQGAGGAEVLEPLYGSRARAPLL